MTTLLTEQKGSGDVMKRILSVALVAVSFVALSALNSCILDPKKTPDKPDGGGGGNQTFKSLEVRDDVFNNLELAYNTRQINEYDRLLDDNFTFFFSPNDVSEGTVQFSQWDRAAEIGATRNMFDPTFSPPNRDPISSIDLSITFPEGDGAWQVIPGTADNGHPNEDWYEKTMTYLLTVKAGDTTFTSGTPLDASIVVRQVEADGKQIFRIVQWRDDI